MKDNLGLIMWIIFVISGITIAIRWWNAKQRRERRARHQWYEDREG